MTAILDSPVTADCAGELLHTHRQAADEVTRLNRFCPVANTRNVAVPIVFKPSTIRANANPPGRQFECSCGPLPDRAPFFRTEAGALHIGKVVLALFVDIVDDLLMQRSWFPFNAKT